MRTVCLTMATRLLGFTCLFCGCSALVSADEYEILPVLPAPMESPEQGEPATQTDRGMAERQAETDELPPTGSGGEVPVEVGSADGVTGSVEPAASGGAPVDTDDDPPPEPVERPPGPAPFRVPERGPHCPGAGAGERRAARGIRR